MANIVNLKKEKKRAYSKNNLKDAANICNLLGFELIEIGEHDLALEEHKEEANLFETLNDPIGIAIAHRRIGEVYSELEEWDKALEHQKKHLSLAIKCKNAVEEQRAHATIGRTHMQRSEVASLEDNKELKMHALKESENSFLKALDTCQKIGGEIESKELGQMRCRIYHNIGLVLDLREETIDAIKFVSQALDLCKEYDFTEDAFRSYSELSKMHLKIDKVSKSLEEAQLSLKYAKKLQNKRYIIDAYQLIAQVHLINDDFLAAKKSFYKAYKVNHPNKDLKAGVERNLKYVLMVCLYRDKISKPETDDETRLKCFDKIGDICSSFGLHRQAIIFYEKRLELALKIKGEAFLAPIYTSLAQTYKDMKLYKKAEEYFNKELEIHLGRNAKEAVATLIEIAKISEELEEPVHKICSYYEKAMAITESSCLTKLQGIILQSFLSVSNISSDKKEELTSKLNLIKSNLGSNEKLELSEEEDDDGSDDEIDLDHFEFSDSDDEVTKNIRPRRVSSVVQVKTNAIGESPLHQAVIKGNVSRVKWLIENHHPINVRDNSGWLPIHEACNWGHLEIAEMLINAGAWVNDRGGRECSGTTPLHDAATNCHFEIVKLLVENNASVLSKNDDGNTPLECMLKYAHKNNLLDEDLNDLINVQEFLLSRMKMAGFKVSNDLNTKIAQFKKNIGNASGKNAESLADIPGDNEDDLDLFPFSEQLFPLAVDSSLKPSKSSSATKSYKSAIESVGSHSKRVDASSSVQDLSKDAVKTPLIPEEEYVIDDWLIEDMENCKKRKRAGKFEYEYKEKSRRRSSPEMGSRNRSSPEMESRPSKMMKIKTKQPKLTAIFQKNSTNNDDELHPIACDRREEEVSVSSPESNRKAPKSSSWGQLPEIEAPTRSPLRLRIKILNKKLLVPVAPPAQSRTIGWLEEEVSRRYFLLAGVKLNLKLLTPHEEVLNSEDCINLVLSSENSELHASVTGILDLPPISSRYVEMCNSIKCAKPLVDVTKALRDCESSGNLNLSKMYLREGKDLQPIFSCICHQNIQVLNVSNCRLEDMGMKNLIQALSSLSLLQTLEAEASSITSESLENLVAHLMDDQSSCKKLTHINLGYNDFSKVPFSLFLRLLSVPSLLEVKLKSCDFSFPHSNTETFNSKINSLYLDDNILSLRSLSKVVCVCPGLVRLSINNCLNPKHSSEGPSVGTSLSLILGSENECLMEYLDISSCNVTNEDIDTITSYLYRCSAINSLHLSANPRISSQSILKLLNEISEIHSHVPLQKLHLHGIESLCRDPDFPISLSRLIEKKALTNFPLVTLSFPKSELNDGIKRSWLKVYEHKASAKALSNVVLLNLKVCR